MKMTTHKQCARQVERVEHPRIVFPMYTKPGDARRPLKGFVVGIIVGGS